MPFSAHCFFNTTNMKISFVLVEPAIPENVGAAPRAMNTMGFTNL